jgi:pimeloyl-ACP methyl ester carboxylesterase
MDDGADLAATLHLPAASPPFPCVVALHGASDGDRSFFLFEHLTEVLTTVGVAVCVYDRRGEGASRGQPGVNLSRLSIDAQDVLHEVRQKPEVDRQHVGLWGISQGGWVGSMTAADNAEVAFVIAVSTPGVSPSEQMHFASETILRERGFSDAVLANADRVRTEIEACYRAGDIQGARRALGQARQEPWFSLAYLPTEEDLSEEGEPFEIDLDPASAISRIAVPTLAIFGAWDRWLPIMRSIGVWSTGYQDRSDLLTIERIPRVGHLMTRPARHDLDERGPVSDEYAHVMADWLREKLSLG